jgi:spermidine synthase
LHDLAAQQIALEEKLNRPGRRGARSNQRGLRNRDQAQNASEIVFEELDYRRTPLGELILRRRTEPSLGIEVYEVKLGDEFLMSSLFTEGETALARYALAGLGTGPLDVVVGGLGLGYTARAVLDHLAVRSLLVVEALPDVIEWHCRGLTPLGKELVSDARCELLDGDFFSLVKRAGIHPEKPAKRFHAIVVDIDHSPRHLLHPSHAELYEEQGLRRLVAHLLPGGVFALWSNDPPDADFCAALGRAFSRAEARVVTFHNPLTGGDSANTVYLASTAESLRADE